MTDHSVFVIDDDDAVRDSLLCLLRADGIRTRAFASGPQFFDNFPDVPSACVVTDVRRPGMDGAEVVRRLKALKGHSWPVVVITGHAEVPLAVQMMKAGVVDYIEKPFEPNRLIEVVRGSLAHLDDELLHRKATEVTAQRLARLTPRESEVFQALIEGCSNKHIANDLRISPRTVEIFRSKVMEKMEAANLSALIRMGLQAGQPRNPPLSLAGRPMRDCLQDRPRPGAAGDRLVADGRAYSRPATPATPGRTSRGSGTRARP
ncbi:MAG: response regulator [Phenylobacterium sp.]|nr:response regulator [Phenylobacterium sp.]